jgi:hypothetical protein
LAAEAGKSGVTGRGAEARAVMVRDYGGTKQSEAAVAMALQWIAKHQNNNGSWSFDHSMNGQRCNCSKVGSLKTSMSDATITSKRITASSLPHRIRRVQRPALPVFCGVGRGGSSVRVALVPRFALGSSLIAVSKTTGFVSFASWISSVVGHPSFLARRPGGGA